MALSLSGERSIAAAPSTNPVRIAFVWIAGLKAARARRQALGNLAALDTGTLRDLGITQADIAAALKASNGHTPGMILNTARARNARA